MSAITIGNDLVHYEVLGRGKPVVLVHSWLGSWRYWIPTMQQLSMKYRTYAIDLWGFGDSGRNRDHYHLEGQVALLRAFVEKMGIPKAVFIGHGLGASVITHYAIDPQYRNKVHRMMAIAPPLFDIAPPPSAKLALPLMTETAETIATPVEAGIDREALRQAALQAGLDAIAKKSGPKPDEKLIKDSKETKPQPGDDKKPPEQKAEKKIEPVTPNNSAKPAQTTTGDLIFTNPLENILGDMNPLTLLTKHVDNSSSDFEKLKAEVNKINIEAIKQSTQSFRYISTYHEMLKLSMPALTVIGEKDSLITIPDQKILNSLSSGANSKVIVMEGMRHFPMLEDTTKFVRLLREFLEAPDVSKLEMKDEWRRRTR
ncbi:MAG: alpha/beta hydrolase [Chloroflexi bacterium]|nr:alpha/beta hydrolase [Chloroflexota bacterium]